MTLRFKKQLMLERLTADGRIDMVNDEVMAIMDNLDGQVATPANWRRQVYDEPVYYVTGKDGNGQYVNEKDCAYE